MWGERCAGEMNGEEQNAQGGKVQVGRGAGAQEKPEGGGGCLYRHLITKYDWRRIGCDLKAE